MSDWRSDCWPVQGDAVNLVAGLVRVSREVEIDGLTIDEACEQMRAAAEGLTDPKIDHDPWEGGAVHITGTRPITDAERESLLTERARRQRYNEYMKAFPG